MWSILGAITLGQPDGYRNAFVCNHRVVPRARHAGNISRRQHQALIMHGSTMRLSTLTAALGFAGVGEAFRGPMPIKSVKAITKVLGAGEERKQSTVHATMAYFDQLIDHNRPELGTFKQRYYYSTDYWQGPGSPISMEGPSKNPLKLEGVFLTNRTMVALIAQSLGGAAVILEHRFYGDSHPPQEGTQNTEYLQPLTLENSIDDLVYFARNAELPFDPEGASHPDKAPWTAARTRVRCRPGPRRSRLVPFGRTKLAVPSSRPGVVSGSTLRLSRRLCRETALRIGKESWLTLTMS